MADDANTLKPYKCQHDGCDKSYTRFYHVVRHCSQFHRCSGAKNICPNEIHFRTEKGSVINLETRERKKKPKTTTTTGGGGGRVSGGGSDSDYHYYTTSSSGTPPEHRYGARSTRGVHSNNYNNQEFDIYNNYNNNNSNSNDNNISNSGHSHGHNYSTDDSMIYTEKPSPNKLLIIKCPHQSCTRCFTTKEMLSSHLKEIEHNCQSPFLCRGCEKQKEVQSRNKQRMLDEQHQQQVQNNNSNNNNNNNNNNNRTLKLSIKRKAETNLADNNNNESDEETEDEDEEDIDDKIKMLHNQRQDKPLKLNITNQQLQNNINSNNNNINNNNSSNNNAISLKPPLVPPSMLYAEL
ncbi:hypothetical protein PPL_01256 [Heterostelium album PN500]|uniref:C2H2-type domain-containing protein n=1 Tax=Heterostelium pallidum (strain ATCC 26659 / Pp 5 / PN500) TaxID=670386 RepID=D3AYJ6_HETP5|nr:hypothetical protein PPL_01256 [Heterostelium album PN500]EFA86023.1 hypothetical protein PPL_01256 [Heterostelium album PN500]|eukprot:XP_020438129.1 hypothetical protein PPL_01256 [Heterostelium album PN500]